MKRAELLAWGDRGQGEGEIAVKGSAMFPAIIGVDGTFTAHVVLRMVMDAYYDVFNGSSSVNWL